MLFLLANVVFAIIGGVFIALDGAVPSVIASICLILGGFTIASRVLAWVSGAAMRPYAIAARHEDREFGRGWRNRMVVMEVLGWIVSIANVSYFLGFSQ